jgi:Uma2 family endonuclease
MSMALRKPMTVAEFLDWEERQEIRYEFDGFEPVAMTGGTLRQSTIQVNLLGELRARLRGGPCRAHGSHAKLSVSFSIRYPDAFVLCGQQEGTDTIAHDPVVIFEILSPSTADTDRTVKNAEYRDTPSVKRYVMLEQDRQAATVFAREGDDWVGHLFIGDAVLAMPEIGIELPLAPLYEDLLG